MTQRSIVGDAINFRGMIYGPVNELGVVALFAKVCEEMGFIIEETRAEYPDCVARQQIKRGWERIAIEFEYRSSNFLRHGHDPALCDLIVCWEHDWERSPVRVLSLKEYVAQQKSLRGAAAKHQPMSAPHMLRQTRLTPGGIKNGYINIKPLDDFWPEECRGGNVDRALQHLIVEFEGVRRVATDISGRHKTLRCAHQAVKKFVAAHGLQPGDLVEIVRLGKYEYRIRPTAR
ncbi:MAG: hypothetical protein WD971_03670 [Pirellulales bacterium]